MASRPDLTAADREMLPRRGFVNARLLPIAPVPGAWLVSGTMSSYRKSDGAELARQPAQRRDFTWTEHGEALMRRRKQWYYRREPVQACRSSASAC